MRTWVNQNKNQNKKEDVIIRRICARDGSPALAPDTVSELFILDFIFQFYVFALFVCMCAV